MIALYFGAIGGNGAQIAFNDDQTGTPTFTACGPGSGATSAGLCRDARLVFSSLSTGSYTLALTVFGNSPPATESGAYSGLGSFGSRSQVFAVDAVASDPAATPAVPEPASLTLLGIGLLGTVGARLRKRRSTSN